MCAKQNSSSFLSTQHHLLSCLFLLIASPSLLPPRLKIPIIIASFSPSAAPQPRVCSQLCLPILALVCPLLCSHCCCPSSGAYSLLPGLQQSPPKRSLCLPKISPTYGVNLPEARLSSRPNPANNFSTASQFPAESSPHAFNVWPLQSDFSLLFPRSLCFN